MALKAPLDTKFGPYRSPLTGKFCDEVDYDTAVSDVKHIRKTLEGLKEPDFNNANMTPCGDVHCTKAKPGLEETETVCTYPDCDCHSSEIIMLSTGYAEVFQDGDVVSGREIIYHEDDD